MNNNEYIQGVLRTESPTTPEMVGRFLRPGAIILLREAILKTIEEGYNLDKLKKYLFYGKEMVLPANDEVDHVIAARLAKNSTIRLLHAAIGMATESAEILDALHHYIFVGCPLDTINLTEEGGDQFWYLGILSDALGVPFEGIMERNNAKLRARYPEKFEEGKALERDLPAERKTLEPSKLVIRGTQDHPPIFKEGGKLRFGTITDALKDPQQHNFTSNSDGLCRDCDKPKEAHAIAYPSKQRILASTMSKPAQHNYNYIGDNSDGPCCDCGLAKALHCDELVKGLQALAVNNDFRPYANQMLCYLGAPNVVGKVPIQTSPKDFSPLTVCNFRVHVTSRDDHQGFIYGFIEGHSKLHTWALPNGTCISSSDPDYNLNMETLK